MAAGTVVKALAIVFPPSESAGLLLKVRVGRREYLVPLCDMEATDTKSANYQPLYDYVVWFANA